MEGEQRADGLENTLFSLLEKSGSAGIDQAGLLIMFSLLNLMGIINLLTRRVNSLEDKNRQQV